VPWCSFALLLKQGASETARLASGTIRPVSSRTVGAAILIGTCAGLLVPMAVGCVVFGPGLDFFFVLTFAVLGTALAVGVAGFVEWLRVPGCSTSEVRQTVAPRREHSGSIPPRHAAPGGVRHRLAIGAPAARPTVAVQRRRLGRLRPATVLLRLSPAHHGVALVPATRRRKA